MKTEKVHVCTRSTLYARNSKIIYITKKAIRIITNKTTKIEGKFQNTKLLFKKTNILTIHNLYFYLTTTEARKILTESKPEQIYNMFTKSSRSNRLILPKFNKERYKSKSFIFNASKIANYFISNNIDLYAMSQSTLKVNLKRYLIVKQSTTFNVKTQIGSLTIYRFLRI